MTIGSLIAGTIISQILFVLTKVIFIHYLNIDNLAVKIIFFVLLIIITIATVRRLGILNYLESFFLAFVWLIVSILVDMAVTSILIGREMYNYWYFWLAYFAIVLTVIIAHKALHVEVRRSNAQK